MIDMTDRAIKTRTRAMRAAIAGRCLRMGRAIDRWTMAHTYVINGSGLAFIVGMAALVALSHGGK